MKNLKLAGHVLSLVIMFAPDLSAQSPALGDGPWEFDTVNPPTRIRVSVVTNALTRPWGLAFLPNGDMLVTERAGTLRIIRNGVLDTEPVSGVPEVAARCLGGLLDIALHPNSHTNNLVYFVYSKPGEIPAGAGYYATTALGRGRFDGAALQDVEDVFVADAWSTNPCGQAARYIRCCVASSNPAWWSRLGRRPSRPSVIDARSDGTIA